MTRPQRPSSNFSPPTRWLVAVGLCSILGGHAHADPGYCEEMPPNLVKAVRAATAAQKKFEQERDDDRADSKSIRPTDEPETRETASEDNSTEESDNVSLAEFGNHTLDQSRERARRSKEKLITAIISAHLDVKPSRQLGHWMACEEISETLKSRDLHQPWAERQLHRFEVRWDQARRGVLFETVATVETRPNSLGAKRAGMKIAAKRKNSSTRRGKKTIAAGDALTVRESETVLPGDEDSPQIATHRMTTKNLISYRLVTTRDARHAGKVRKRTARKSKLAKKGSALKCFSIAARDSKLRKTKMCRKMPVRHANTHSPRVAKS